MDLKKVYVVYDSSKFTITELREDLRAEGYNYEFLFGDIHSNSNDILELEKADEVWVFGNCKYIDDYTKAIEMGKDIWQMK